MHPPSMELEPNAQPCCNLERKKKEERTCSENPQDSCSLLLLFCFSLTSKNPLIIQQQSRLRRAAAAAAAGRTGRHRCTEHCSFSLMMPRVCVRDPLRSRVWGRGENESHIVVVLLFFSWPARRTYNNATSDRIPAIEVVARTHTHTHTRTHAADTIVVVDGSRMENLNCQVMCECVRQGKKLP